MKLSLDELEAERGEVEPFELDLGDKVISLPHPRDLPFQSLIDFDAADPARVLRVLMGDETFDQLAGNPRITIAILERILNGYYVHFGLGSMGEGGASRASSRGSAGQSRRPSPRKATA